MRDGEGFGGVDCLLDSGVLGEGLDGVLEVPRL